MEFFSFELLLSPSASPSSSFFTHITRRWELANACQNNYILSFFLMLACFAFTLSYDQTLFMSKVIIWPFFGSRDQRRWWTRRCIRISNKFAVHKNLPCIMLYWEHFVELELCTGPVFKFTFERKVLLYIRVFSYLLLSETNVNPIYICRELATRLWRLNMVDYSSSKLFPSPIGRISMVCND